MTSGAATAERYAFGSATDRAEPWTDATTSGLQITSRVTHEWVGLVGGTHGPWDRGPSATQCLSMWLPAWPHCAGPTASDPLPLSLIAWRFSIHEVPKREGSRLVAVTLSQKDKNIK